MAVNESTALSRPGILGEATLVPVARPMASALNLDMVKAELSDSGKISAVEYLLATKAERSSLAFVCNKSEDEEAMTRADVGISIGSLGSERSMESADIMIMSQDLKKLPEKPIIIAFDDGYLSNYTKAFPILKKYGMKATIFIVASTVGKMYPEINYSHFTWAQAREMRESGLIEIGSHTYYHNDVSLYSPEMAAMDLRLSKYLIDTNLNYNCTLLAFPYGHCTEENQQQALDAGYELSCKVGDTGVNTKYTPITGLKRLTIYGTYTSETLINYINIETYKELCELNAQ